jgi:hypothetical protein
MSTILFIKKGDFKSGFFSKKSASEFRFYEDKIIIKPMGLNLFFNSADILIPKSDIIRVKDGYRLIGYNIIVETKTAEYTFSFLGDKLMVLQVIQSYLENN